MNNLGNRRPQGFNVLDTTFCRFEVGMHVVCIDTSNFLIDAEVVPGQVLEKGRVYTISAISIDYAAVAVQIAEHPFMAKEDGWYGHWRFRPLQKLKVEDFTLVVEHRADEVRA